MPRQRLTDGERRARAITSARSWRSRNLETARESARVKDRRARHGLSVHDWIAEQLAAQEGNCYLCGEPLGQRLIIDHDHSCCPEGSSCAACRRGLTCDRCNRLIGQVGDDPATLRRIADALEAVLVPTRARIADLPEQLSLGEGTPDGHAG
jgi:hypothetical protein